MSVESSPLQGPLGYLLVGEIVGVVSLSWVCVGMFLRKLRATPEAPLMPVQEVPNEPFRIEDHPEYQSLLKKVGELEAQLQVKVEPQPASEPAVGEVEKLQKTISYLENKLLEYEIVQEEIATLGELKKENEKLKTDLLELKSHQLKISTEAVIEEKFTEFAEKATEPERKEPSPGEIENLLTDIEKLAQEVPKKDPT